MKAKIEAQKDTQREPQPGEHVLVCDIDFDSEVWQYFTKVDEEFMRKYDRGPVDDESL